MLSRDCGGCSQRSGCASRFARVEKGGKVYCADGTAHLVDSVPTSGKCLATGDACDGESCFCTRKKDSHSLPNSLPNKQCTAYRRGAS